MRDYQWGFYNLSERVRDRRSRQRQAEKLRFILGKFSNRSYAAARCLDLGCSSGVVAASFASLFGRSVGLDFDEVALREIEPNDKMRASFVRGDAMRLPFRNCCFDLIICAQVYEHVPDDRLLAQEMHRVLVPGGIVLFSGPNWLFPIEPHYFLPFLHWLPPRAAGGYLRLFGLGTHYYERSRSLWGLRKMLSSFAIRDFSVDVLYFVLGRSSRWLKLIISLVPAICWKWLLPIFPNYNWVLIKPNAP
jgi:SAM-dependent methyltransferase